MEGARPIAAGAFNEPERAGHFTGGALFRHPARNFSATSRTTTRPESDGHPVKLQSEAITRRCHRLPVV